MADAKTIVIDPKDYRIDGRLMRRIWRLAKPYWSQPEHWKSWVLMIFSILISPAWAYYGYRMAQVSAEQANALVAKDQPTYMAIYWLVFWLGIGTWVYGLLMNLFNTLMNMQWYRWMTQWMMERYLASRTYYDIAVREDIDNPDERIQDNVQPFIGAVLGIPGKVIGVILGLITNGLLLTQVSSAMTTFVVIYSAISMIVSSLIYIPMIRMNFDAIAAKADLRYGILRVRDHAETIAFFRGEKMEAKQVNERLWRSIRVSMRIFYYNMWTGVLQNFVGMAWSFAPLLLIYPLYFKGEIEFGTIALATSAAGGLMSALTQLDDFLPLFAGLAPSAVRLAQVVERWDEMEAKLSDSTTDGIEIRRGDHIRLDMVSFATPGGERTLVNDLNVLVNPGESLMIIGQTGVGKSSLLRAMARLWSKGQGVLTMPPEDETMFVPQKPYMMLGDLRAQLLYPRGDASLSDEQMQAVLERVCLPDLISKQGGLSAEKDWSKVLSLGEQQRISFARVLISKPRFVFLDEATSAMDIPTENTCYQALAETGCTFLSVGHRETILKFHDRALRLLPDGGWEILNAQAIPLTEAQPLGAARQPAFETDLDTLVAQARGSAA